MTWWFFNRDWLFSLNWNSFCYCFCVFDVNKLIGRFWNTKITKINILYVLFTIFDNNNSKAFQKFINMSHQVAKRPFINYVTEIGPNIDPPPSFHSLKHLCNMPFVLKLQNHQTPSPYLHELMNGASTHYFTCWFFIWLWLFSNWSSLCFCFCIFNLNNLIDWFWNAKIITQVYNCFKTCGTCSMFGGGGCCKVPLIRRFCRQLHWWLCLYVWAECAVQ